MNSSGVVRSLSPKPLRISPMGRTTNHKLADAEDKAMRKRFQKIKDRSQQYFKIRRQHIVENEKKFKVKHNKELIHLQLRQKIRETRNELRQKVQNATSTLQQQRYERANRVKLDKAKMIVGAKSFDLLDRTCTSVSPKIDESFPRINSSNKRSKNLQKLQTAYGVTVENPLRIKFF